LVFAKITTAMKKYTIIILLTILGFITANAICMPYKRQPNKCQEIDNLLKSYYQIKDALVEDNSQLASEKAGEFIILVADMPVENMTDGNLSIWKKYSKNLKEMASIIHQSTDIENQRRYFNTFSNDFYEVLIVFKVDYANVYLVYCPRKNVYWLSNSKIIQNPYFGSKLLDSGIIKATLK
jgi:Protein of unknown function (DUF3347)